jgi:hypothetical protein
VDDKSESNGTLHTPNELLTRAEDDVSTVNGVAHESGFEASNLMTPQQSNDFRRQYRKQQQEIASRLQKAVSEKLKIMSDCKIMSEDKNISNNSLTTPYSQSRIFVRNFSNKSISSNTTTSDIENHHNSDTTIKTNNAVSHILNDNDNNNNIDNNDGDINDDKSGNYLLPCPLCEIPLEPRVFRQHLDHHYPRDSPICPVLQCGRRFAHPNSVRNHMRLKHSLQWAKMKAMRSSGGPFSGIPY